MAAKRIKRTPLTEKDKIEILKYNERGKSQREIARITGRSPSSVNKVLNDEEFVDYRNTVRDIKQGHAKDVMEHYESKLEQSIIAIDNGFQRIIDEKIFKNVSAFDIAKTMEKLVDTNLKINKSRMDARKLDIDLKRLDIQHKELELSVTRTIEMVNPITEDDIDG